MSLNRLAFRGIQLAIGLLGSLDAMVSLAQGHVGAALFSLIVVFLLLAVVHKFLRLWSGPRRMRTERSGAAYSMNPSTGFSMDGPGGLDSAGYDFGEDPFESARG